MSLQLARRYGWSPREMEELTGSELLDTVQRVNAMTERESRVR